MKRYPGKCTREPEKDALLCDALADGISINAAAHILGVSRQVAYTRFKRICNDLGEQAQ